MDHHVPRAVTNGLRLRGVDVPTAHEDGTSELHDPALLERAELGRVLFTQDNELLAEATRRQRQEQPFSGVSYAHRLCVSVGGRVRGLKLVANVNDRGRDAPLQFHAAFEPFCEAGARGGACVV